MFSRSEKERDAPNPRKRDKSVDDACEYGSLSAADPRDNVEFEKPDASPVERTDDGKREADFVHYHNSFPF